MKQTRPSGWVYILTNSAMPNLVKIGHTARRPEQRAAELTGATGVPAPFIVAWAHPVVDHEALEGIVHGQLAGCRARHNREFFRCSVPAARRIIEREARAVLLPWWQARLYRLRHPLPALPRSPGSTRRPSRRTDSGLPGLIAVLGGGFAAYVLAFRPGWIPPDLWQLLYRLPHF